MAARSQPDWRAALVESYADLFHPHRDPLTAPGWPAVGDGWQDLLKRACRRIRDAVREDGGMFRVVQIKEKYGTLRVYWEGALTPPAVDAVEEAVDLAEARSMSTCEVCGEIGVLRGGGWMTTRCDAHADGRGPVEVLEGFENLHVERRLIGGRWRTRFRVYDREADRFVDVGRSEIGEA